MGIAERLRFLDGQTEWTGKERVALGGISRGGTGMFWVELTNISDRGEHNFSVDGDEVHAALQEMRKNRVSPHVLWHSHFGDAEPSTLDIRSLPAWLSVGVVWSASSTAMCTYDRNGLISSTKPDPLPDGPVLEAAHELAKAGILKVTEANAIAERAVNEFALE